MQVSQSPLVRQLDHLAPNSEILLSHLANLQEKVNSVAPKIALNSTTSQLPLSCGRSRKLLLPFKIPEEEEEEAVNVG